MQRHLQNHGTETTNKNVEEDSLREALKTGSITEWADVINSYVRSSMEQNDLTEDKCRSLLLLIGDLVDRDDFTDEDEKVLHEMTADLMKDIPLYACACALNVLAFQMSRDEFDENLLGRTVYFLRSKGYSYKKIKKSVNKTLSEERKKRFSDFLSEIKDNVETYLALDRQTDGIAEQLLSLGNEPWTENQALTEAVNGMSWATEMLLRDGHLDSAAYLDKKDGTIVYPLIFKNDREKDKSLQALQMLVDKTKPDAVTVFAETWVGRNGDTPRPSQDPDRKEAIMVTVETPLGYWHGLQCFTRDENGNIVLDELIAPTKTNAEGKFVFMDRQEEKVQCNA